MSTHLHSPVPFDGGSDLAEHVEDVTGFTPDPIAHLVKVPVEVVSKVTVEPFAPRSIATEQIPVSQNVPTRVLGEVRHRQDAIVTARGGDVYLGGRQVTTSQGYLLSNGTSITLNASCEVWALAASGVATSVHILSEHKDG